MTGIQDRTAFLKPLSDDEYFIKVLLDSGEVEYSFKRCFVCGEPLLILHHWTPGFKDIDDQVLTCPFCKFEWESRGDSFTILVRNQITIFFNLYDES